MCGFLTNFSNIVEICQRFIHLEVKILSIFVIVKFRSLSWRCKLEVLVENAVSFDINRCQTFWLFYSIFIYGISFGFLVLFQCFNNGVQLA